MAALIPRDIGARIVERVRSGIVFILGYKTVDEVSRRFGRKYVGEHSELLIGGGVSVFGDVIAGMLPESVRPVISDIVDSAGDYGLYKEFQHLVDKIPVCWASDPNTLVCKNLDSTTVSVKVDGTPVTVSSTSGTAEDLTIYLATALSAGEHELIVVASKKAFYGKIVV